MTRPESDLPQKNFSFDVVDESSDLSRPSLLARPLNLRKQALAEFDAEFILEQKNKNDSRFELSRSSGADISEAIVNARALMREHEYRLAHDLFRAILKIDSKSEVAIRGVAECARQLGRHDEAIQVLKQLVSSHLSAANCLLLADEYYALEYNEDALAMYLKVLTANVEEEKTLFHVFKNMGNVQLRLGDVAGAEESYNKAYTIDPDSDALLTNFGSLELYRGDSNRALDRFREAVSINDRNDKAWVGLAMIHRKYGDVELAWANLEKALDINSDNESAIRLLCEWAMKDMEVERAIRYLDRFLQNRPDHAMVSMWYAKFLYFSGRLDAALVEIEKTLYLEPMLEGATDVLNVIQDEIASRRAGNASTAQGQKNG